MTVIRDVPPKASLEQFAPKRRPPENDVDQTVKAFEAEIRQFVRRDVTIPDRQQNETGPRSEPAADNLRALIERVSGASMEEIDRVIRELQGVRDMLHREGDRVSREITGYASLNHAAMTAMKVIADSLTQWKNAPNNSGRPPAD
ncbi:MAG TPA: hypothetical protein VI358_20555 [Pseudolabrys sp.]